MHRPSDIVLMSEPPQLDSVDYLTTVIKDKQTYEKKLKKWQQRMLAVQQAYYHQQRRAIIVFEGWDASGKGGAIRRLTEKLDPRGFDVVPVAAPTAEEAARHYLYRFQTRLPMAGTMTIFDRSWYGRVLVERVEGFATEQQWQRAYQEINEFERSQLDDGTRVVKIFMHIDPDEQLKRFKERLNNPYKRWKLTAEDLRNRAKWGLYSDAANDMFRNTGTEGAPWHLISANHKWYARLAVIKAVCKALEAGVDTKPPEVDQSLLDTARSQLGADI